MCGIAGYFGEGNRAVLTAMTDALRHRGPDDTGVYVEGAVGLGHRRLAVIDLTPAGHQPMSVAERVTVVFNGEIYNFRTLRQELERSGYRFRTHTDTEVILQAYLAYGAQCFDRLEGMFALALYDREEKKLLLARDRLGKKPLYWSVGNGTLLFGSELKALRQHPCCPAALDLAALNQYLSYEYVLTPHTIIAGINKLEPGHYLIYDGQRAQRQPFWSLADSFARTEPGDRSTAASVVPRLDELMDAAVADRLVSDVPLGVFLSGGIDSSAIAYYAQKNSARPIDTFAIGFREASFDESRYARLVAQHLGTNHHEQIFSARDSLDLIPQLAEMLDEPLADASILPTYLLSRFARTRVTVALGGDGGDELFGGYDTFRAQALARWYERIPAVLRNQVIEKIARRLPVSFRNISFDFKVKQFLKGLEGERDYRHHRWLGAFDRAERRRLFLPEVWRALEHENEYADIDRYRQEVTNEREEDRLIYLYLRTYLMDDILVKVDRASMRHGLEVRTPFLDRRVVEFVNGLPWEMKVKGLETKYLLKQLMAGKLPNAIINRRKKGFGIPLAAWLCHELKPLAQDLLSEERIKRQGLFDHRYITQLLDDHWNRRADNRKLLWTLMVFMLWEERWGK